MEVSRTTAPVAAKSPAKKEKTPAIISILPSHHLDFFESRTTGSEATMELTNLTDGHCAFKIKTTRPKKYCVKPNWGRLGPHESKVVKVILQSPVLDEDDKPKHKFLVQSMATTQEATDEALQASWKSAPNLLEARLKCNWHDGPDPGKGAAKSADAAATAATAAAAAAASPAKAPEPVAAKSPAKTASTSVKPAVTAATTTQRRSAPTGSAAAASSSVTRKPASRQASSAGVVATSATVTKAAPKTGDTSSVLLLAVVFVLGAVFGRFVLG